MSGHTEASTATAARARTRPVVAFDPLRDKTYQSTRLGRDVVDFLAWLELGGTAARTLDQYERDLARGAKLFPDKGMADLTDGDLLHIAKKFKPGERRVRVAAWRSFYKWGLRTRRVTVNPCDVIPTMKRKTGRVFDIFTEAEVEALCALPARDGALMRLMFDAGLRKADARHLQLRNYRPNPAPGELVILDGKGGKDRLIPATLRAAQAIADLALLEGLDDRDYLWYSERANSVSRKLDRAKPIGEGTFARWWRRCLTDAGVRYRNPHMARHTFATNWLRRGGRLETLTGVMGHASIRTTFDQYGHLDVRDAHADLAVIEGRA